MNLGQTMITAGMLVLLTMSVISANRMLMEVNQSTYEAESMTASSTIANDLLDEILGKKFDAWSDTTGSQSSSSFSMPPNSGNNWLGGNGWGPTASERTSVGTLDSSYTGAFKSKTYYTDVDDYNGYTRMVTMNNISGFIATVQVWYVNSYDPDTPLTTQNTYKKITVSVQHPIYMTTPQVYTALASY